MEQDTDFWNNWHFRNKAHPKGLCIKNTSCINIQHSVSKCLLRQIRLHSLKSKLSYKATVLVSLEAGMQLSMNWMVRKVA